MPCGRRASRANAKLAKKYGPEIGRFEFAHPSAVPAGKVAGKGAKGAKGAARRQPREKN